MSLINLDFLVDWLYGYGVCFIPVRQAAYVEIAMKFNYVVRERFPFFWKDEEND